MKKISILFIVINAILSFSISSSPWYPIAIYSKSTGKVIIIHNYEDHKKYLPIKSSNENEDVIEIYNLVQATIFGKIEIVDALLKNGANPNDQNAKGKTALMVILEDQINNLYPKDEMRVKNLEKIIKLIISYGADINIKDKDGYSAVDVASELISLKKRAIFRIEFLEQLEELDNIIKIFKK